MAAGFLLAKVLIIWRGGMNKPDPFLTVRVHDLTCSPGRTGLCVGYERGEWRAKQLAEHAMVWLPEFSLSASECEKMNHANSVLFIERAAKAVYETEKFEIRGEFGELFLHIAIRQVFDSEAAISKLYYKTANNETVKGFDAVHVVGSEDDLELWIGEAKFYNDIGRAIRDVVKEIKDHTKTDYLRSEFALIMNKVDDSGKHAAALKKLLDPNTSLDEVFQRACIPVLLTYDSQTVKAHKACDGQYETAFVNEVQTHWQSFAEKNLPAELRIHLFLLPLHEKKVLVEMLDERLKIWQSL